MKINKSDIILQAEVGSSLWGLNLENDEPCNHIPVMSTSCSKGTRCCTINHKLGDRDEMGIALEPLHDSVGFNQFEVETYRTATERTGKSDAKSEPGDLDLTIYSLRKWLRLALKGNPTILTLLFVPQAKWVNGNSLGTQLQEQKDRIISKQAGKAFLGYLQGQRQKMIKGNPDVHRKELEEKYGYDPKYAMHMLRLGYQGIELLSTGCMGVPIPISTRTYLLGVRRGEGNRDEILKRTEELEEELSCLLETSGLPVNPDYSGMEKWMIEKYWYMWKAQNGNPKSGPLARFNYKVRREMEEGRLE